jgi:hypothetical protein
MTSKKNQNNKRNQSYKINYKKKHNNITGPQMKLFDDFVKFVIDIALFLKDNNITFTTNIWGEALGLMIQLVKKLREDKNKKDNNMLKDINVLYVRIGKLLEGIENFVDIYKDYIQTNRRDFLLTNDDGEVCITYNKKIYLNLSKIYPLLTKRQRKVIWSFIESFTMIINPDSLEIIKKNKTSAVSRVENSKETKFIDSIMDSVGDLGLEDTMNAKDSNAAMMQMVSKLFTSDLGKNLKNLDTDNLNIDNLFDSIKHKTKQLMDN